MVFYAEPANPQAIAEAIRGIMADYERMRGQTLANTPRVRETFSSEVEAARLGDLYNRLLFAAKPG